MLVLAAAATVEVETKLEVEVKADLEASVIEDENDMVLQVAPWETVRKIFDQLG